MSTLVPAYSATRSLQNSQRIGNGQNGSSIRAVVTILNLFAKVFVLLLLSSLLISAGLVWAWLASFRSGWQFGGWLVDYKGSHEKLSLNILSSGIVALLSPLAIFGDWSQNLIREKLQIQFPPKLDLRQIVEKQLGVQLPENLPCLPEKAESKDS